MNATSSADVLVISDRRLLFIMLNPGTADESHNDPTIRRCIGFAERWKFGIMEVANLFAFRTSYVTELRCADEPVGSVTTNGLESIDDSRQCGISGGENQAHTREGRVSVRRMVLQMGTCPYHLGLNKTGEPKHPLYLPASTIPIPLCTD